MMLRGFMVFSLLLGLAGAAHAQSEGRPVPAQPRLQLHGWTLTKAPDRRVEFIRACTTHMSGRWAHPQQVCGCLHDHAAAVVDDTDLREALLRGIGETGVPTIENDWVPPAKQSQIAATFTRIAKPALQCMFDPLT
jgi:hypothetical protein